MKNSSLFCLLTVFSLAAQADDKLARAAMQRDVETVRLLLAERGADVNAVGPYETPALHWLVRIEDHDLVKHLLEMGADANKPTGYGLYALSIAIENRDLSMVQLLLAHHANVNQADHVGETPLMLAARTGSLDVVRALIKAGAKVDVREPQYQQTALMIAVRAGATAVANELVAKGADVNAMTVTGEVPQFRLPAQNAGSKGIGISRGGWPERGQRAPVGGAKTPLLYATRLGNLALVKLLVEHGANINSPTPMV